MVTSPGSLVGRSEARAAVDASLTGHGRAWLSGLGGVGKSRLAREVFAARGGAWVDLSSVTEPAGLVVAIGGEVAFPPGPRPTPSSLAAWCSARGLPLLVLDDADAVAGSVLALLEVLSPALPVLVTARTGIGMAWEVPLQPLDPRTDGVRLFLARVPEHRVHGVLDPEEVRAVVESLGGLPLAIELAAARLAVVPLERLREGLQRSLALLRDPEGRTSIEATLRWSWDRLASADAELLAACAVFDGPFPLDGAAASVGRSEDEVLDPLHRLVRYHLVDPSRTGDEARFELHPLVRRFARDRLAERDEAAAVRAHARWVASRAARLSDALRTTPEAFALARRELTELHAVLARAERVDPDDAARVLLLVVDIGGEWRAAAERVIRAGRARGGRLWREVLRRRAAYRVRRRDLAGALADAELGAEHAATDAERAVFLGVAAVARLADGPGHDAAAAQLDVQIEASDNPQASGLLRSLRAIYVHGPRGDHEAALRDKEARLASVRDDRFQVAGALDSLAVTLISLGRGAEARIRLEEAAAWCDAAGLTSLSGEVHGRLAGLCFVEGDLDRAEALYGRAIAAARQVDDRPNLAHHLVGRALLAFESGGDAAAVLAELDPGDFQRSWTLSRATAHLVRALVAYARCEPPPAPPEVAPDPVAAALVADTDRVLDQLGWLERGRLDPAAALDLSQTVLAELAAWPSTYDARAIFRRIVRARIGARVARLRAWRIEPDGSGFVPPLGDRVDLGHRLRLAAIVRALARGGAWTVTALGEEAWPGERTVGDSMRNRVQVAVSTLRGLGLSILLTTDEGYRLDPSVVVEAADPPVGPASSAR